MIKNGSGTGIKQVYYFSSQGNNTSYIKLGTLNTVSVTGFGTSKVMFTIKGGINFGGTNESVYEVAASIRGSIQVTSTLVRGNRELKFGYVSTSSNVEIWMAYDGTYRGATEVEVSSSVNFTLTMTETTTKPSGFVEGSYRILAATADNVASATKLQTPRTIWGQSFDGTRNVSGSLLEVSDIHFKADNSYDIGSDDAASRYIYTHWLGARSGRKLELGANNSGFGEGLCIDTNLNVGIGTNSPAYKLHVAGDAHFSNINVVGTATIGGNCLVNGGVTAYQSSDIRLKTNINKLNCLNVIKSIGGTYEFDYIRDHKHSIGFIAQNVNNPLLKDIVAKDDNGYLKINYWNPKLISLAFGALTEIDDEVDKLKARVRELESEVKYLKNKAYALQ